MSLICSQTESRFRLLFSRNATEPLELWDDNFVLRYLRSVTKGVDIAIPSHTSGDWDYAIFSASGGNPGAKVSVTLGYTAAFPEQAIFGLPVYEEMSISKHLNIPKRDKDHGNYGRYPPPQNADLPSRLLRPFVPENHPPPNINFTAGSWFNPNDAPPLPFPWKSLSLPETDQVVAPSAIFPDYAQSMTLVGEVALSPCHREPERPRCVQKPCKEPHRKAGNVRVHPYTLHPPKSRGKNWYPLVPKVLGGMT